VNQSIEKLWADARRKPAVSRATITSKDLNPLAFLARCFLVMAASSTAWFPNETPREKGDEGDVTSFAFITLQGLLIEG
jgi:hypothetical protein